MARDDAEATVRVVVTGFEAFDGREKNRSWELVRRIRGRPGTAVIRLPVDFRRLGPAVSRIVRTRPDAILMVGEASTPLVRVEQIGLNVVDAECPDNAGRLPRSEPVVPGGALALEAWWDARKVVRRLHQEGIEASVSFHAGTFACNAALYRALHLACEGSQAGSPRAGDRPAIGFLHIPNVEKPAGLEGPKLTCALEIGLEELLATRGETRALANRPGDAPE